MIASSSCAALPKQVLEHVATVVTMKINPHFSKPMMHEKVMWLTDDNHIGTFPTIDSFISEKIDLLINSLTRNTKNAAIAWAQKIGPG